jgi:hypothetical protein
MKWKVVKLRFQGYLLAIRTVAMSTKLIDITKQLKTFLSSTAPTVLLQETNGISGISIIEAHIQKRRLEIDRYGMFLLTESSGDYTNCINIVNIAVAERNRRKGLLTDFLELLEGFDYGPYLNNGSDFYIRVDKVMNPVLDEFLPKRGYARLRSGDETHHSYHKIVRYRKDFGSKPTRKTNAGPELAAIRVSWDHHDPCPAR